MSDVITIYPSDADYPEPVRSAMKPPTLYAVGNLDLLERDAIGICGSRDASSEALRRAFDFGREAAERGFVVVSGYAKGVDRQAHRGALEAGGRTIAALPEGIGGFRVARELRPLVDMEDNFLAVSMFEPAAPWRAWRAMERNKLIVGLSQGLFVVEANERGGTINAAMECARQRKPLWAVAYSKSESGREGNSLLLRQDMALPLERLSDVRDALEKAASGTAQRAGQITMAMG